MLLLHADPAFKQAGDQQQNAFAEEEEFDIQLGIQDGCQGRNHDGDRWIDQGGDGIALLHKAVRDEIRVKGRIGGGIHRADGSGQQAEKQIADIAKAGKMHVGAKDQIEQALGAILGIRLPFGGVLSI